MGHPHRADIAIGVRPSYHWSPEKTVISFTEYEYDNGHIGFYPLYTNEAGLLKKRADFKVEDDQSCEEGRESSDEEGDREALKLCDESYHRSDKQVLPK